MRFIAAVTLLVIAWFGIARDRSPSEVWLSVHDYFDARPSHRVLILGNSRTFYNDMPAMVRRIADSAGATEKYQMTVLAPEGASFKSLSEDMSVQSALAERWDDVVLQGESRGQSSDDLETSFNKYGALLAGSAHPRRARPLLVINWAYDPNLYQEPGQRAEHLKIIRADHLQLAGNADLRIVDFAAMWERVRSEHPALSLTVDGNHPSVAGSYLFALALYAKLSGKSVSDETFVPAGVSSADASVLRSAVDETLG